MAVIHYRRYSQPMREAAERSTDSTVCNRCGGVDFFRNRIFDPANDRSFHLFRCKVCDNHQWSQLSDDRRSQRR